MESPFRAGACPETLPAASAAKNFLEDDGNDQNKRDQAKCSGRMSIGAAISCRVTYIIHQYTNTR